MKKKKERMNLAAEILSSMKICACSFTCRKLNSCCGIQTKIKGGKYYEFRNNKKSRRFRYYY